MLTALRSSARSFARAPGSSLALLVTIALGIGGNAAVAGFVRGSVAPLHPLAGGAPVVSAFARDDRGGFGPVSQETFHALASRADLFASIGAARESQRTLVRDGRSSIVTAAAVTPAVAGLLALPLLPDGVVVSDRLRQIELAAADDARGETIRIDGADVRVAGVAPPSLDGLYAGRAVDVWLPLEDDPRQALAWRDLRVWVLGTLAPGLSIEQARAGVASAGIRDVVLLPYDGMTPEVAGVLARVGGILTAAAAAVFLVACVNVATCLLSRASGRVRETSIRLALGAGRRHLAQQLLCDGLLVTTIGGALGVLLAVWTSQIIPALFFEQDAEQLAFAPHVPAIVAVSAACAAVTIACALVPLAQTRYDPGLVLRRESVGPSAAVRRVRAALVAAQMALCCLLVTSTALLLDRFGAALETGAGRRLAGSLVATVEASRGFARQDLGLTYFAETEQAVRALPGVTAVAWVEKLPGARPSWQAMRAEPADLPMQDLVLDVAAFTQRSLASIALPPLAGRMFGGADTPDACRVAIVNAAAARDRFDDDAVGRSLADPTGRRVQIVGVVEEIGRAHAAPPARPTIYYYADQTETPFDVVGPALFRVPGRRPADAGVLDVDVVSPGYFEAAGIAPIAGALFSDQIVEPCRVGVVNEEAADRYFHGPAVGGAVVDAQGVRTTIVGVVRSPLLRATERAAAPTIYLPLAQDFRPRMTMLIRARESNAAMLEMVRRRIRAVPGGGASAVTTLERQLGRTALAAERIVTVLVAASAAIALVLGVFGVYGAMADAARQRRAEIGVRIALGAPAWRIVRQVLADGARLAVVGSAVGALGALVVARWLTRVIPGDRPGALLIWTIAPLAMAAVVAVAGVLPARWALRANPLVIARDRA